MYCQLSASVKLRFTEYDALVVEDSLPLATCTAVVESAKAVAQAPELPPVTLLHDTVTADVGTVAQLVKEVAAACTFRFQVEEVDPLVVFQLTTEAEFPATLPRSGSVEVKLIVLGVAVTVPRLAANGITVSELTIRRDFCCAVWAVATGTTAMEMHME